MFAEGAERALNGHHQNIHRTQGHLSGTLSLARRQLLAGMAASALLSPPIPTRAQQAAERVPLSGETASLVLEVESGTVRHAAAADRPLTPASTVKLITALAALDLLGPDHRFPTDLWLVGQIADGRLMGELILRGSGDPLFDLDQLLGLVLALRRAGIAQIDGRFIYDESAFPTVPQLAAEEPEWAAYNAGVGPLGVAFDRVSLVTEAGRLFSVPPIEAELRLVAAQEAGPEGVRRLSDASGRTLAWLFAADRPLPSALPVREPGRHAALVFRHFATSLGIGLPRPENGRTPAGARLLARHESPPVRALVRAMLHYSKQSSG